MNKPLTFEQREAMIAPILATASGKTFNLVAPSPVDVNIKDIAAALSKLCRFNGHCREFYSVAQHSVLVSYYAPERFALYGLLHDAAEAYLGDMPSPLKRLFPNFKSMERKVSIAVLAKFGLFGPIPKEVKHADLVALRTEQRDLMHPDCGIWDCLQGIDPHPKEIHAWSPEFAKRVFLNRFKQLTGVARA